MSKIFNSLECKELLHYYFLICPVALWPSLPPPGGAAGMYCRSAALPQALLTPAAAPEADPDCLHLLRRLLIWISSEGPSPDLGSTKHAEIPDEVREATFIFLKIFIYFFPSKLVSVPLTLAMVSSPCSGSCWVVSPSVLCSTECWYMPGFPDSKRI